MTREKQPEELDWDRGQPEPVSIVTADELLGSARELLIENNGEVYRLLLTKNGKLLLNKHTLGAPRR